jgi:hypothetical protein
LHFFELDLSSLFRHHNITAASNDMNADCIDSAYLLKSYPASPSTHEPPSLHNPSDEELKNDLNELPRAALTGVKAICKLLKERHPRWELAASRVRIAWKAMKKRKYKKKHRFHQAAGHGSDAITKQFPLSSDSITNIEAIVATVSNFLPHFIKKQVAALAFFSCAPGDIRHHAGEREGRYRDMYDDMITNTQLWMQFLDVKSNHKHADSICGILVWASRL